MDLLDLSYLNILRLQREKEAEIRKCSKTSPRITVLYKELDELEAAKQLKAPWNKP